MNQHDLYNLTLNSKAGFAATILRSLAGIAGCAYSTVIQIRNFLYSHDLLKSFAVTQAGLKTTDRTQQTVPVISIGNITAGGTGKTPMVIWLCNFLQNKGVKCAILTRGYKSAKGENDEPAMLTKNCTGAAVVVNPDRLAGAIEAVKRHRALVLVMDDGFQHRRLHRDIDIVTIDATRPFGFGKILPAGLLREPVTSLKRANAAIITRSDHILENDLSALTDTLKKINPNMTVAQAIHSPLYAISAGDKKIPLEQLRGKPVFAFCGIANPDAFFATIEKLGAEIVGTRIYDDHHSYSDENIEEILQQARQAGAAMVITTEKDFNKIGRLAIKTDLIVAYLAVKMKFVYGQELITGLIEGALAGKIQGVNKRYV
ncbi:MAG: tetraacyldisaccharide 4'-kinase [Sedimentisphaerales bacterium]